MPPPHLLTFNVHVGVPALARTGLTPVERHKCDAHVRAATGCTWHTIESNWFEGEAYL